MPTRASHCQGRRGSAGRGRGEGGVAGWRDAFWRPRGGEEGTSLTTRDWQLLGPRDYPTDRGLQRRACTRSRTCRAQGVSHERTTPRTIKPAAQPCGGVHMCMPLYVMQVAWLEWGGSRCGVREQADEKHPHSPAFSMVMQTPNEDNRGRNNTGTSVSRSRRNPKPPFVPCGALSRVVSCAPFTTSGHSPVLANLSWTLSCRR
jgi:hypothetical protein